MMRSAVYVCMFVLVVSLVCCISKYDSVGG